MINNEQAFIQKYDFDPLFCVTKEKSLTDCDCTGILTNDIGFVCEFKKDTLNHTIENVTSSGQWNTYRKLFKPNVFLIYATHNEEISDNIINTRNLIVRYVELDGKSMEFKQNISLLNYLNGLASIGMYYIKVTYPNNVSEIALISPNEADKWSSKDYWAGQSTFKTEDECKEYIKKRYEKDFNQKNIYSIYHVDSMKSAPLIHRYTYEEIIGL